MPIIQYIYGQYHPRIEYTLKPNLKKTTIRYKNYLDYSFTTNRNGFRGNNWDDSPSRKNIVILGDSYAFGWGIEEKQSFANIIANKLAIINPQFQVINLAQSGYFIDQIVNCFDIYGKYFNPILVIYLYCYNDAVAKPKLINDQYDIRNFRENITSSEFNAIAKRNNANIWSIERSIQGSYLNAFTQTYLMPAIVKKGTKTARRSQRNRFHFSYKNLPPPTPPNTAISLNNEKSKYIWYCLNKLRDATGKGELILMDTSSKIYVHNPDSPKSDRWLLRDFANKFTNSHFTNFESEIRLRSDGIPRFFNIDAHWNIEGHDLATSLLWKTIAQEANLLPGNSTN